MYNKTKDTNQAARGSTKLSTEPTRFSLQTQMTMPVQPSYTTQREPSLTSLPKPEGNPPAAHPAPYPTCVRLTTFLLFPHVFPEPGIYTPP